MNRNEAPASSSQEGHFFSSLAKSLLSCHPQRVQALADLHHQMWLGNPRWMLVPPIWMVYNWKPFSSGWFGATPILGNPQMGILIEMGDSYGFVPFLTSHWGWFVALGLPLYPLSSWLPATVFSGVLWFAFVSQPLKSHLSAEHVFFADLADIVQDPKQINFASVTILDYANVWTSPTFLLSRS